MSQQASAGWFKNTLNTLCIRCQEVTKGVPELVAWQNCKNGNDLSFSPWAEFWTALFCLVLAGFRWQAERTVLEVNGAVCGAFGERAKAKQGVALLRSAWRWSPCRSVCKSAQVRTEKERLAPSRHTDICACGCLSQLMQLGSQIGAECSDVSFTLDV